MEAQTTNAPITIPECTNPKVPAPTNTFHHYLDLQTRFNDFDQFGHLNNSVYFQLLDTGKIRYFEAVMHADDLTATQIGTVIVNINISFFSPTYAAEQLAVVTACTHIGKHSFTLEQRMFNPVTGDVKCIATSIMASFDLKTARGTEVPDLWSGNLRAFEAPSPI